MAPDDLPQNVLYFLDNCIDSVEQLQVLLLLQNNPDRIWTVEEITAVLRSADTSIFKRLEDLYARGVLSRLPELQGKHKYAPTSDEMRAVISELASQNRLRPYRVIDAIYLRTNKALRSFASAFKFRKDKS